MKKYGGVEFAPDLEKRMTLLGMLRRDHVDGVRYISLHSEYLQSKRSDCKNQLISH
jgi:hypothetical protein